MAITARRHALGDRTRPSRKRHIGLATMETLLTLVWTLLLGAVTRLLTGFYLYLLPLQYVISASMVAWLESPVSASRTNPLTAFGLVEASRLGRAASQWQTLLRIFFTPPMLLAALIGFIPLLSRNRSLPEILSGTRIVPLNPALDPRSSVAIRRAENRIRVMVRSYTVFSLAIAGLILLVPVRLESILDSPVPARSNLNLMENDQQLLAIYLDLSTQNPDEVEYHVRLASLYYRNGMEDDLRHELQEVRRLDPDHAILILDSEFESDFGFVFPEPDSIPEEPFFQVMAPVQAADTTGIPSDSLAAVNDSLPADPMALPDSLPTPYETPPVETTGSDSSAQSDVVPDTLILPETEPLPIEIVPATAPADTSLTQGDTEPMEIVPDPPPGAVPDGGDPGTPE